MLTPDAAVHFISNAIHVIVLVVCVLVVPSLLGGLLISIFQAATQINEQTLSFVPKLAVLALTLFIAAPWMLTVLIDYTRGLYAVIPELISFGM